MEEEPPSEPPQPTSQPRDEPSQRTPDDAFVLESEASVGEPDVAEATASIASADAAGIGNHESSHDSGDAAVVQDSKGLQAERHEAPGEDSAAAERECAAVVDAEPSPTDNDATAEGASPGVEEGSPEGLEPSSGSILGSAPPSGLTPDLPEPALDTADAAAGGSQGMGNGDGASIEARASNADAEGAAPIPSTGSPRGEGQERPDGLPAVLHSSSMSGRPSSGTTALSTAVTDTGAEMGAGSGTGDGTGVMPDRAVNPPGSSISPHNSARARSTSRGRSLEPDGGLDSHPPSLSHSPERGGTNSRASSHSTIAAGPKRLGAASAAGAASLGSKISATSAAPSASSMAPGALARRLAAQRPAAAAPAASAPAPGVASSSGMGLRPVSPAPEELAAFTAAYSYPVTPPGLPLATAAAAAAAAAANAATAATAAALASPGGRMLQTQTSRGSRLHTGPVVGPFVERHGATAAMAPAAARRPGSPKHSAGDAPGRDRKGGSLGPGAALDGHASHPRDAKATRVGGGHAAGGGAAAVKAAAAAAAEQQQHQQQQLCQQLGEAMQIRSVPKPGSRPSGHIDTHSAGVPGRRGKRLTSNPSTAQMRAAATAAYFADMEATLANAGTGPQGMLPHGLVRRLKAARQMALGPPPFQRRRELPPPPSPSGVLLDGFLLLEAADEEMPEAVQAVTLASRAVSAVQAADLPYFIALRQLDVSDNRLPDMACLANLPALVQLRAASCRLATLGAWECGGGGEADAEGDKAARRGADAKRRAAAQQAARQDSRRAVAGEAGEVPEPEPPAPEASAASTSSSFSSSSHLMGVRPPLAPFNFLEVLDLSYNQLQPHIVLLPGCPLAILPRLAELDLSSNHLKYLPSPEEISLAAAGSEAAGGGPAGAAAAAFPALRRLRLAHNGLKNGTFASLAALGLPSLTHLDLDHNCISETALRQPLISSTSAPAPSGDAMPPPPPLARLALVDLSYNRVAAEAAVGPLLALPALQRVLLAGNPLASAAATSRQGTSPKIVFDPAGGPAPKPSVAASFTARFARISETPPRAEAANLAAAAAATITAAVAPERVADVFDRTDATIEQWRLNTVMEEDEEEENEDDDVEVPEDRTFLTGVGISEKASRPSRADDDPPDAPTPDPAADGVLEAPLWESIADPTERLAVALGLDPLTLPMHTRALTTDAAGALASLRFTLAHPLVEADEGMGPPPRYTATTTATALKRRPRKPAPSQRLAPMAAPAASAAAAAAAPGPKAIQIQTVEGMLSGMKGRLAELEAQLAAQLAAAPAAPRSEEVAAAAAAGRARLGVRRHPEGDSDDGEDDDNASRYSGLADDVIDEIERESSEDDEDAFERALEAEAPPLDPKEGLVLLADQAVDGTGAEVEAIRGSVRQLGSAIAATVHAAADRSESPGVMSPVAGAAGGRPRGSPPRGTSFKAGAAVPPLSPPPAPPAHVAAGAASALGYAA